MPTLLNRTPFPNFSEEIIFRRERVRLRADQIIIWVTLNLRRFESINPAATPFPAILDTGHNFTFSLHERHLIDWARLRIEDMKMLTAIRDRGLRVHLRAANIWIHPNEKGSRDQISDQAPYLMEANRGIAVYPGSDFPRLPIFGLRAIADNNLVLKVDGPRREATLRTPIRWWPL